MARLKFILWCLVASGILSSILAVALLGVNVYARFADKNPIAVKYILIILSCCLALFFLIFLISYIRATRKFAGHPSRFCRELKWIEEISQDQLHLFRKNLVSNGWLDRSTKEKNVYVFPPKIIPELDEKNFSHGRQLVFTYSESKFEMRIEPLFWYQHDFAGLNFYYFGRIKKLLPHEG